MKRAYSVAPILVMVGLMAGCAEDAPGTAGAVGLSSRATGAPPPGVLPGAGWDRTRVARGGEIFQEHCAQCHGAQAQGAPDWRRPDASGAYPAPPLDGTGHAWHHPSAMLRHVIRNGSPGGGAMPAWKEKLTDEDIDAVIAWFQSKWPVEVYAAWSEIEQRALQARR